MEAGTKLYGFEVTRVRKFEELGGHLVEMTHEKTGARLCWLDRPEQNKTFAIAFQTLPEDSTGVFHILEHAVLCGSDKYPVKDTFVELLKSSVQTFLNAMTMADRTVYPVSSRNDRDFLNLIDVYLDAVFHPMIYHGPESFLQEGWRYALQDGALSCQGVVLNEMKGSFASTQTLLEAGKRRLLFPDTCYGFVSGGDPEQIPKLSYDRFLEAHKRFYHPSNAWISLVGSIDVDAVLCKLLSYTHLWNEIRVKGGAYGCGLDAGVNGDLVFYSYRDPQPDRSLKALEEAEGFLRDYLAGDPDLSGFLLSAVSELDPCRNPEEKLAAADGRFFSGIPEDRFLVYYRQLLHTTPGDLFSL